ncbi:MAG: cytidine deaminase [Bacillota bacterium]|nr:cytidine deaminase [Bacillota bacterium]
MELDEQSVKSLINKAALAKENAYCPYSRFRVGAALLTDNGNVYLGSNVENASLGATICAERSAIVAAVSNGERKFKAIAIAGDKDFCYPCGICRQFISEFGEDIEIISVNGDGDYERNLLSDIFSHMFKSYDGKY